MQGHGKAHGYNVVVKSSSTPTEKKPGRTAKVWLRCDRGGHYRPRNGLTEETRKRRRTSRLMDCPFMLVAAGTPGIWTLTVLNPTHNHGPIVEKPRQVPHHKVRKGQIAAIPYDWPHDATLTPYTTALVVVDMQKDCMCYTCNWCRHELISYSLRIRWLHGVSRIRHFCFPSYRSPDPAFTKHFPLSWIPNLPHKRR